jgi:hypothetical protein
MFPALAHHGERTFFTLLGAVVLSFHERRSGVCGRNLLDLPTRMLSMALSRQSITAPTSAFQLWVIIRERQLAHFCGETDPTSHAREGQVGGAQAKFA